MNQSTLPNDAELWRMPRVEVKSGLKSSRIYEMVAEGTFPRPVKLGPRARASAWVSTEVLAWIAERISERDAERPL